MRNICASSCRAIRDDLGNQHQQHHNNINNNNNNNKKQKRNDEISTDGLAPTVTDHRTLLLLPLLPPTHHPPPNSWNDWPLMIDYITDMQMSRRCVAWQPALKVTAQHVAAHVAIEGKWMNFTSIYYAAFGWCGLFFVVNIIIIIINW